MLVERAAEAADDHAADQLRIAKPHLGLRRVDVHIDLAARHVEEQRDDRMTVAREQVGIGTAQRPDEQPVLNRAPVDEQILMVRDAAIVGRQADHAADVHAAAIQIDADAVCRQIALRQRRNAAQLILPALHVEHAPSVMLDHKPNVGARHRQPLYDVKAGGIFATRAAQEFAASRDAREQILDRDAGALGERRGSFGDERAIVDNAPPAVTARDPAVERQPRNAGDRRQRLAPKTQRADILDRVVGQLRSRMAFERQRHVRSGHAAAVILNLQPRNSALGDSHRNATRAGVDGVFDQFFQRCGGSFDHFTGCDPIYQRFGQATY